MKKGRQLLMRQHKMKQESPFEQLVQKIRTNAEVNTENLQYLISREYKIYKILPEGEACGGR